MIIFGHLHGGRGPKNSGKALPPPFSGNARKKTVYIIRGVPQIL